jgi:ankyrin repeat protein
MAQVTFNSMKKIISGFLFLAATTFMADARAINPPDLRKIDQTVDIIAIAKPVSTTDTDEQTNLPHISPDVHVIGLSSVFEVVFVLKGDTNLTKLVVHHYRLANSNEWAGVALASFNPKESTNYLMFLKREWDGRYAPYDQVDPAETSILKLNGARWDKMNLADFKEWFDAKKWLDYEGNHTPLGWSGMSPEISAAGRGDGSLFEAAFNGKLEKAKALIKANPDLVNSQASYGEQTPLQIAAEFGHMDVAELLLANKANIEAQSYGGWSPLLNAVFGGHKDMVELLLTNKANVNYKENAGRTPLHVAAENGYTEIAALLLANGANVNAKCRDGYTPMHVAAVFGNKDLVDLLVANKAEYNIQDAAAIGDLEKVKVMLKDNPDLAFSKDFSGQTALHWAATQGRTDVVKLLLANKADVNAKAGKIGSTPLFDAVSSRHKEVVELLLTGGADVNAKSNDQTPLRFAESVNAEDIADLLRQHGGVE